jgi:hypothetical protein
MGETIKSVADNDKTQVIFAVLVLGLCDYIWAVATGNEPGNVTAIISGLFGVAVGRASK